MTTLKEVPTDELLSFQDFPTTHNVDPLAGAQITIDVSPTKSDKFNANNEGDGNIDKLDDDIGTTNKSFWSFEYFQQYFDVDTNDVVTRILGSMIPMHSRSLHADIKQKPDLYGPFWISVTLVFAIAICGNIANYLHFTPEHFHWKYHFYLVFQTAGFIILYLTLMPIYTSVVLYGTTDRNAFAEEGPKLLELLCLYGYSLFIYIPTAALCIIQVGWLQWSVILLSAFLSGSVVSLQSYFNTSRYKIFVCLSILCVHLTFAVVIMFYFFILPFESFVNEPTSPHVIANTTHTNKSS